MAWAAMLTLPSLAPRISKLIASTEPDTYKPCYHQAMSLDPPEAFTWTSPPPTSLCNHRETRRQQRAEDEQLTD